jgi:hypothetical protein
VSEYIVKRPHLGDKDYKVGDVRKAKPNEVAHLVKNQVLEEIQTKLTEQSKQAKTPSRPKKAKNNDQPRNSEATLSD